MALVALAMVGMIAMAALSIDIGTLYQASAEAQKSADAAALAAAKVLSLSGMTGDPTNINGQWQQACNAATAAAQTVANQNPIGGSPPSTPTVNFFSTDGSGCTSSGPNSAFGVNPMVTVKVTQPNLSTFFAHIFGLFNSSWRTATVAATATAEVYNPSNSGTLAPGGDIVPVQPRSVKPWIVPNQDPLNVFGCQGGTGISGCKPFVNLADGSIRNPGINAFNAGVIGEQFNLIPDCNSSGACGVPAVPPPVASSTSSPVTLQYIPGQVVSPVAVPSCAADAYEQAVAGCEQASAYQCGVQLGAEVDFTQASVPSDTSTGTQCLIHQTGGTTVGQDILGPLTTYPFPIKAGSGDPLNVSGSFITNSNSIVTVPIYDSSVPTWPPTPTNANNVTIVGFLQVFVNQVDPVIVGSVAVTVLNVSGCGNGQTTTVSPQPVYGTSPVPVRLITPPPS